MPSPRYKSPDFKAGDFKEGDFANRFGYSFAEDTGPATVGITETASRIIQKIVVADLDIIGIAETRKAAPGVSGFTENGFTESGFTVNPTRIKAAVPDTVAITEHTFVIVQTGVEQPFNPALFGGPSSAADRPHVRYTTPKKTKAQLALEKEVERALRETPKKEPITISKRLRSRYNIESIEVFERNKAIKELIDKATTNTTRSLELFQASFSPKPIIVDKKPRKQEPISPPFAIKSLSEIEADADNWDKERKEEEKKKQQQHYMRSLSTIEADQKTTIPKLSPIEEVRAGIKNARLNKTIRQITQMKEVLGLLLTIDAI